MKDKFERFLSFLAVKKYSITNNEVYDAEGRFIGKIGTAFQHWIDNYLCE